MANIIGTKWGSNQLGTAGGTVTWSIAAAGTDITRFGIETETSVSGESFLDYDFEQVIADAFAEWSKYGDIEFEQVADQGGAAGVGADADIRIFFGAIPGGTAGYAFYPSAWGSAIAGDILLDTISAFNNDPVLFFNLVLHEIGHALGLGHVSSDSIMTPSVKKIGLQADDIAGIQEIYGVQDDAPVVDDPVVDDPVEEPNDPPADDPVADDPNNDGQTGEEEHTEEEHNHDDHDHSHETDHEPDHPIIDGDGTNNRLIGSSDAEMINGHEGNDTIIGVGGDDTLAGGDGDDRVKGGDDNDVLLGQSGYDKLIGRAGNDLLSGGADADVLKGGLGEDTLNGGTGNDKLIGDAGDDVFEFADDHGHDIVKGFDAVSAGEKIDLRGISGLESFGDVQSIMSQVKSHVKIETGDDSSILLKWVNLSDLDANDFLF